MLDATTQTINPTGLNTFRSEFYCQSLIPQRALRICSAIQQAPPTYPLGRVGNGDMGNVTAFLLSYFPTSITNLL